MELHATIIKKAELTILSNLQHFVAFNHFCYQIKETWITTINNFLGYLKSTLYTLFIVLNDELDHLIDDYKNYSTNDGPYLLVKLNSAIYKFYYSVFSILHVIGLCVRVFSQEEYFCKCMQLFILSLLYCYF